MVGRLGLTVRKEYNVIPGDCIISCMWVGCVCGWLATFVRVATRWRCGRSEKEVDDS